MDISKNRYDHFIAMKKDVAAMGVAVEILKISEKLIMRVSIMVLVIIKLNVI